ncbi:hypothetical protein AM274_06775 [Pseudomonas nunensis]|nr:hypothetical protein AM274_06775 [Pseudomonas nunensis]
MLAREVKQIWLKRLRTHNRLLAVFSGWPHKLHKHPIAPFTDVHTSADEARTASGKALDARDQRCHQILHVKRVDDEFNELAELLIAG